MNMIEGVGQGQSLRLDSGDVVPCAAPEGRRIVLGVRPEDLHPEDTLPLLRGQVAVQEPLGHETLIYVNTGGQEIIAKADGRTPPAVGSDVTLSAALENLHLFDADTGETLQ